MELTSDCSDDYFEKIQIKKKRKTTMQCKMKDHSIIIIKNEENTQPTKVVQLNNDYTGAPIVGIARWSVPRIGQGHLEVKW